MTGGDAPAKWWIGPPAPRAVTWLAHALQLAVLVVVSVWVFGSLGGLRLSPRALDGGANDTGALFNWHPLLMTLAFPVLMGSAVLAFKAPPAHMPDRQQRKMLHLWLLLAAVACAALGLVPAFLSHTLKRPAPIPNLYSAHSAMGLAVVSLMGLQFLLGLTGYLWPKLPLAQRKALGPLHVFLGLATFTLGLATMATGVQEKATFLQLIAKAPVFSSTMRLPAAINLLLLFTGLLVLYHHAPSAAARQAAAAAAAPAGDETLPLRFQHMQHEEEEDAHVA